MIKRPFALAGFSFVFALLALNLIDGSAAAVAVAAAVCLLLCLAAKKLHGRKTCAVALLCVLAACGWFQARELFVFRSALELTGENVEISAVVTDEPQQSDSGRYVCTIKTPDGFRLRLGSSEKLDVRAGDTVSFCGRVYELGGENEEIRSYYKSKNVFLGCRANGSVSVTPRSRRPALDYVNSARGRLISSLASLLPGETGAVAAAMITGDKAAVSETTKTQFTACGLSHILAVSGLHMSIVVLTLYSLLRRIFRKFCRVPPAVCIVVAVLYAALAGFTPSALRACIMVCVMLAGRLLSLKSDALNSLGLAALLLTLLNPYAVLDLSFMLSFSATLGIVLFADRLVPKKLLTRIKPQWLSAAARTLSEVSSVTLIASVFCLPVYVMFIGSVSLVFLPANLLTFFAVPAVLVFGLLAAVTGVAGKAFAFVCGLNCKHILAVLASLSSFDGATQSISGFTSKLWLGCTLLVVAAALLLIGNPRRAFRFCAVFVCVSVAVTSAVSAFENRGRVTVSALGVADGCCFAVSCGSRAVLIGCGGDDAYAISDSLSEIGIETVELLILPRIDKQSAGCAKDFLRANTVAMCVLPERNTVENLALGYEITQKFSYDFCGARLYYEYSGGYAVCRLEAGAGSVLFTFAADTPKEMLTQADFLFSRAQPPACLDTGSFEAVVVSDSRSTAVYSDNAYSTFDNGTLTLSFNGRGVYEIEKY